MFRSGTTLMGKCLNSHTKIAFALDPMLEVFREVRNQVYPVWQPTALFSHLIHDYSKCNFKKLTLSKHNLSNVKHRMIKNIQQFSPKLCNEIEKTDFYQSNIYELIKEVLYLIDDTYGKNKKSQYIGFKEVWGEEFGPAMIYNFPETKIIHIIRNPRAVVASSLAQRKDYTMRYLCKFWKKSATIALDNKNHNYKIIQYENLINQPYIFLKDICDFLGLQYDDDMLNYRLPDDKSVYESGANSSYEDIKNKVGFRKEAINRWRKILSQEQIDEIKELTYPEISKFGYEE